MRTKKEKAVPSPHPLVGREAQFEYPCFGYPDSHPDYTAHSGQTVKIVRQFHPPDIDPEMSEEVFEVEASDGWRGTANRSELRVKRAAPKGTPRPARGKKEKWKICRDGDGFPGIVADQDWVMVCDCYAATHMPYGLPSVRRVKAYAARIALLPETERLLRRLAEYETDGPLAEEVWKHLNKIEKYREDG